jgi:hypothetical protein
MILKAGGSAVDAVEAAIRVLEDKEITNAGYGSNLTLEGIVECDATVVDHFGRSGACGATASEYLLRLMSKLINLQNRDQESNSFGANDTRYFEPAAQPSSSAT